MSRLEELEQLRTPVLMIIFNRPQTTKSCLQAIAKVRPERLFVAADGPRPNRPDDIPNCQAARSMIDEIDWPCVVERDYAESNLGLRARVESSMAWVFNQVAEAIILEDDCIADPTFFYFCDELLEHYRDDPRIWTISGNHFPSGVMRRSYSYYFSRYIHIWGWATWRRTWQHYDGAMSAWPRVRSEEWLKDLLQGDRAAINYWEQIFQRTYENSLASWDYRLLFSSWMNSGLNILPMVNLVENIGYLEESTHRMSPSRLKELTAHAMEFPLQHPPFIIRDDFADRFSQSHNFSYPLITRIRRALFARWARLHKR